MKNMIKLTLFVILIGTLFSGCINKRGISAKYYSECKEYYDYQGYYHKDCDDEVVSYKDVGELLKRKDTEPKGNVY